jgi:hypothetical protein
VKDAFKGLKKWFETFDEMQKEITVFVSKIFEKYALFVFITVFFLYITYYIVLVALELVDKYIVKLPILEYKPYYGYIYAFPDASRAKNYRLKFKKLEDGFYLFFPNGGSKYFEYCEEFNSKGELFGCETENDTRDWNFRFYNERVK